MPITDEYIDNMMEQMDNNYNIDPERFTIYDYEELADIKLQDITRELMVAQNRSEFEYELEFFFYGILIYYWDYSLQEAIEYITKYETQLHGDTLYGDKMLNLAQIALIRGFSWELFLLLDDYGFAATSSLRDKLLETYTDIQQNNGYISDYMIEVLDDFNIFRELDTNNISDVSNLSRHTSVSSIPSTISISSSGGKHKKKSQK